MQVMEWASWYLIHLALLLHRIRRVLPFNMNAGNPNFKPEGFGSIPKVTS